MAQKFGQVFIKDEETKIEIKLSQYSKDGFRPILMSTQQTGHIVMVYMVLPTT